MSNQAPEVQERAFPACFELTWVVSAWSLKFWSEILTWSIFSVLTLKKCSKSKNKISPKGPNGRLELLVRLGMCFQTIKKAVPIILSYFSRLLVPDWPSMSIYVIYVTFYVILCQPGQRFGRSSGDKIPPCSLQHLNAMFLLCSPPERSREGRSGSQSGIP